MADRHHPTSGVRDGGDKLEFGERVSVLRETALELAESGKFNQAYEVAQQALAETEAGPQDQHYVLLSESAWYLSRLGMHEEALAAAQQAASGLAELLGENHLATVDARNNVARFLWRVGRIEEAVALGDAVLSAYEDKLGAEDDRTLVALTNLVNYYIAARDGRNANAYGIVLCQIWEKRGEWDHPKALEAKLAAIQAAHLDGWAVTDAEIDDLLARFRRVLGETHPNTIRAQAALAELTQP